MVTALKNSEKPRPVREHQGGASRNRHIHITGGTGPVAITVQDGQPRRRLVAVGDTRPFIEVPRQIDVEALASALNAILNGVTPAEEVTAFEAITAAAFAQGIDYERSMAGVA